MLNRLRSLVIAISAGILLASSVPAAAQKAPPDPKTIPDSITYIWNDVEHDFTAVAEAMPEDKWSFKPTQGEFKKVRTFAEQVKHVACANFGFAAEVRKETPPEKCDVGGGPDPSRTTKETITERWVIHYSLCQPNATGAAG